MKPCGGGLSLIFNFWSRLVHFAGLSWYLNLPLVVATFSLLLASCFFLGVSTSGFLPLPLDPTLVMSSASSTGPVLPTSLDPNLLQPLESKSATVVVAEGVPMVSCRLVEKIRRWEYVNMADLLKDYSKDTQLSLVNGAYLFMDRLLAINSCITLSLIIGSTSEDSDTTEGSAMVKGPTVSSWQSIQVIHHTGHFLRL